MPAPAHSTEQLSLDGSDQTYKHGYNHSANLRPNSPYCLGTNDDFEGERRPRWTLVWIQIEIHKTCIGKNDVIATDNFIEICLDI